MHGRNPTKYSSKRPNLQFVLRPSKCRRRRLFQWIQNGNHHLQRSRLGAKYHVKSAANVRREIHKEGPRPNTFQHADWCMKIRALRRWNCCGMYVLSVALPVLVAAGRRKSSKGMNCYPVSRTLKPESMNKLDKKFGLWSRSRFNKSIRNG